jgi:hypothetical protein
MRHVDTLLDNAEGSAPRNQSRNHELADRQTNSQALAACLDANETAQDEKEIEREISKRKERTAEKI